MQELQAKSHLVMGYLGDFLEMISSMDESLRLDETQQQLDEKTSFLLT